MKLLYHLSAAQLETLALRDGEELRYCVPVDLEFDNRAKLARDAYAGQVWLGVTGERFLVLEGEQVTEFGFKGKNCEAQIW